MMGRDAVKRIRDMGFKNVVLGVTGNVLEDDLKDFKSHGAGTLHSFDLQ